jgi:acyl carrier protein
MEFILLQELIADTLGIDEEKITIESDLASDLGADSLDAAELIMAIEDKFGISISDNEAQKFKTVAEIWDYILLNKN